MIGAALSGQKAVMPEDALNEREARLRGNNDSLDDADKLLANGNGHVNGNHAADIETGLGNKVDSIKNWILQSTSLHQYRENILDHPKIEVLDD